MAAFCTSQGKVSSQSSKGQRKGLYISLMWSKVSLGEEADELWLSSPVERPLGKRCLGFSLTLTGRRGSGSLTEQGPRRSWTKWQFAPQRIDSGLCEAHTQHRSYITAVCRRSTTGRMTAETGLDTCSVSLRQFTVSHSHWTNRAVSENSSNSGGILWVVSVQPAGSRQATDRMSTAAFREPLITLHINKCVQVPSAAPLTDRLNRWNYK